MQASNIRGRFAVFVSALVLAACGGADISGDPQGISEASAQEQSTERSQSEASSRDDNDLLSAFTAPPLQLDPSDLLMTNVTDRSKQSLNGTWNIVVDEHQMGERAFLGGPYYARPERSTGMELVEFKFDERRTLQVPGDWNSQDDKLFRYRGVVWYEREFELKKEAGKRYFLHFDGVNYDTKVFVNGEGLGKHRGGYVAFNFDATDLLKDGNNFVVVRVDANLDASTIPTKDTSDFFKYGGITRDVNLVSVPDTFIRQYQLSLSDRGTGQIDGFVQLDGTNGAQSVTVSIPEAGISETVSTNENGYADISFNADLILWSPENPKLYDVTLSSSSDEVSDRIGFRTIETDGKKILLNGKPVYFRGISMHDESTLKPGVAYDEADARAQLGLIKEMNGNYVRLSHYPHNEYAVRMADEMGVMVWSEIPIVSNIDWTNDDTRAVAKTQISDNIRRDLNRASVVMWSIGNETFPQSAERLSFLKMLADTAREEDKSDRLIAAALVGDAAKEFGEVMKRLAAQMLQDPTIDDAAKTQIQGMVDQMNFDVDEALSMEIEVMLEDKLGDIVDVIGYNEYFGWYYSSWLGSAFPVSEGKVREHMFMLMDDIRFKNAFGKPIIISEFGAGAKYGNRSEEALLWSEDYQAKVYEAQTSMLSKSEYVQGMSPWILKDFKSAMRNLNGVQDIYNRKGVVSEKGEKKLAFSVLQDFYAQKAAEYAEE